LKSVINPWQHPAKGATFLPLATFLLLPDSFEISTIKIHTGNPQGIFVASFSNFPSPSISF